MNLTIKHVQAKGFKAITDSKLFELYPHTVILGENSQGKTTIGDAIAYCLYGCNMSGNNKTDNLLNKESKEMYVAVTAQIDDVDHIITRHRKGNSTTVTLDNRKVNQDELARLLPSKQVFLSIFCPEYFLNLTEAEGRSLIGGYLQPISKDDILNSLTDYERELLQKQPFLDVNVYLSELKDDLKQHEIDITKEEGALEQYQQDLFQLQRQKQTEISADTAKLEELEQSLKQIADKQRAGEQELQQKKEELLNQKAVLWKAQPELKPVPTLNDIIRPIFKPVLMETKALDDKLNELRAEYKFKRSQLEQMEHLEAGATCPTCLQIMGEGHIAQVKQQLQREMQQINDTAQSYKHDLERLQQMNQQLQSEHEMKIKEEQERANAVIQQIIQENEEIKRQYQEDKASEETKLRNEILQTERKILLWQDECRLEKEAKEKQLSEVRESVKQAELHNQNCQHFAKRIQELEVKLEQMQENIRDYTAEKQYLLQTISAAKAFALKQVELQAAQLKQYLNHVEIKLKEIVKTTGESKDCFKVTYDQKLVTQLSASERIKAALEISHLIKQLSGCVMPVFVDNAESITSSVMPASGQCIECRVVSNQPLIIQEDKAC